MTRLEIATNVEAISNVKEQRELVNSSIQTALQRVYQHYDWPFYMGEYALETIDDYTTGTADVVNGSKTVSGTATVWTADMVGMKFRVEDEDPYYRIAAFVSATEITLEQNYQGSTATGNSYEIYQDEYRLASEIDKYKTMRQLEDGVLLTSLSPTQFDSMISRPREYSDPTMEILIGTKPSVYTTGTVQVTTGKIIYGTDTAWTSSRMCGVGKLGKIRIGDKVYTIKSVDSATRITVYEDPTSVAAGTAYEVMLDNLVVQLYQIPDAQRLLYYRAFRRPAIMYNDYDIPDMPSGWEHILMYGALSDILAQKGDINKAYQVYEGKFLGALEQMKLKIGSFTPDRIYVRGQSRKRASRGLEASNFDIRYST